VGKRLPRGCRPPLKRSIRGGSSLSKGGGLFVSTVPARKMETTACVPARTGMVKLQINGVLREGWKAQVTKAGTEFFSVNEHRTDS